MAAELGDDDQRTRLLCRRSQDIPMANIADVDILWQNGIVLIPQIAWVSRISVISPFKLLGVMRYIKSLTK
jgi:hypothetical protein